MTQDNADLLSPADDDFHPGEGPWHTEGSWWSFSVPERRIGGWIYHLTRQNLGTASGGIWVWDHTVSSSNEVPYFLNHHHQILGPGPHNLNDFTWADGVRVRTLEPLHRYRLTYADRELLTLDLTYEGLNRPYVSVRGEPPKPFRWEQPCRVRGRMVLHGEEIAIDCIAMRDHSWGQRPESTINHATWTEADMATMHERPVVYLFGVTSADSAFFVMMGEGYLNRGGHRVDLRAVRQSVERDPDTGYITQVAVEGVDHEGRTFRASGRPLSMLGRPSAGGFGMIYLMQWEFDGGIATGELQDIWPIDLWSAWRRHCRAA